MRNVRQSCRKLFRSNSAASRREQLALSAAESAKVEVGERVLACLSNKLRDKLLMADLTFEMSDDQLRVENGRTAAATLRDELAIALTVEDLCYLVAAMTARVGHEPARTAALKLILSA